MPPWMSAVVNGIQRRVRILILLALATTWIGFLGDVWWFFDLFSHFRLQYLALCVVAIPWFAWDKSGPGMALSCLGTLVNAELIFGVPWATGQPRQVEPGFRLRLASINVHTSNRDSERVLAYVRQTEAEAVFLMEVDEWWAGQLAPLKELYPHHLLEPREDNFGVAFFCKHADATSRVEYFGRLGVPSVVAEMRHQEKSLRFIGTHPIPPMGGRNHVHRNEQLGAVRDFARRSEIPVLVAGDFNATPWSSGMRVLLGDGLMKLPAPSLAWAPSWMARAPVAIPIDHAVAGEPLIVLSRVVGPDIGSDHRPILVEAGWAP